MKVYTTGCPRNCYSTCTMKVYVENNRLKRIESHPGNQATREGPCLKGLSYIERVHSPHRILDPLRKIGWSGEFEPISWDVALETIAERLRHYRAAFGPQSVFYYNGSGTKGLLNIVGTAFWKLYGGCTTTFGDLCWSAGLEATRLTLGENKHNAPWDIAKAKLIVLWGKNAAETNIHQMPFINEALDGGAKLIVIDPRRTESSERAQLLIQPRPGSDGAVALAIAHLLIRNDKLDGEFIDAHVHGFSEFAEMVEGMTPERASQISDVPVGYIHEIAGLIGEVKPVTINAGFGMQRYTNSGQTMRAILALLAITGNIGKPGAGWIFANLQSHIFDKVKDPIAFYPPKEPDGVVRVSVSTAKLGRDMIETDDPPLKMVWVERGNPVTQNPETDTVLEAFRSLDFRVVVEQFLTDTAREADIVLPAKTMFEQTDVINAYWHTYIQLKQKVMDPPGNVKPESEMYFRLAQRLGIPEKDIIEECIPGPTDADVEAFLKKKLEPFPELSIERLREGPVLAPGQEEVAFSDMVFQTPSGKIELVSQQAKDWWGVDPLPTYVEPEESIRQKTPESGKYPLYFLTPNTKDRIHSQFNNLDMIRDLSPAPFVEIHPEDARSRGITDRTMVRVFNERGSIELEARYDYSIKRGCVSVTNGWWISEGGTVNICSLGRETDMAHGAAFHDALVEVERAR
ncbi:MAG: molybdopterin-dependent oxidoreductase [Candidatus Latescibacterota bacterium]|nr:MAG: molybdopterin-dependent oxidoreductase [Candidatus Latescibacterota bacterium]